MPPVAEVAGDDAGTDAVVAGGGKVGVRAAARNAHRPEPGDVRLRPRGQVVDRAHAVPDAQAHHRTAEHDRVGAGVVAGGRRWTGEFAGKRQVVRVSFAEAAYLGRGDHEAALGQGAPEVFVVAVRLPALGAVLPQPDDVAHAVAVPVQGQHARRRPAEAFRYQHVHRHGRIRPGAQHDPLADVGAAVDSLLQIGLHRRRGPIQEAQVPGEHAGGVRLPRAGGVGGRGGKRTVALRSGMQCVQEPERVEFGSFVHGVTVELARLAGKQLTYAVGHSATGWRTARPAARYPGSRR